MLSIVEEMRKGSVLFRLLVGCGTPVMYGSLSLMVSSSVVASTDGPQAPLDQAIQREKVARAEAWQREQRQQCEEWYGESSSTGEGACRGGQYRGCNRQQGLVNVNTEDQLLAQAIQREGVAIQRAKEARQREQRKRWKQQDRERNAVRYQLLQAVAAEDRNRRKEQKNYRIRDSYAGTSSQGTTSSQETSSQETSSQETSSQETSSQETGSSRDGWPLPWGKEVQTYDNQEDIPGNRDLLEQFKEIERCVNERTRSVGYGSSPQLSGWRLGDMTSDPTNPWVWLWKAAKWVGKSI
ncbi:hypothetical protein [Pasteuria penetrans]|uniref:hypothetical protein n=1 Tax=Pasteuria penetrans TaxID=86005 RepID=UPI000FBA7986|nr:hypothetical protein [Pasteuria penetrans]